MLAVAGMISGRRAVPPRAVSRDVMGPASSPVIGAAPAVTPTAANRGAEERAVLRPRYVRFVPQFLDDPASPVHNGDRRIPIRLDLYDDVKVDFYVDQTRQIEPGVLTVTGHTDTPLSLVVFAKVGSKVVATVSDPDHGEFTIEPTAESGVARIYQLDQSALHCESAEEGLLTGAAGSPGADAGTPGADPLNPGGRPAPAAEPAASGNTVDDYWANLTPPTTGTRIPVLATYNAEMGSKAVALYGSLDGLRARLEVGLAMTNAVLQRAGSAAVLDLVGLTQITLDEQGDASLAAALTNISRAPEYTDLQIRFRPALTVFVSPMDNATSSGRALIPGQRSVIVYSYVNSIISPHEFGHNFGMSHNVEDAGSPNTRAYGYGWRLSSTSPRVGDAMSYQFPGVTTFILPAYSDPNASFRGVPLGSAEVADNARVARELTAQTAAYTSFQFGALEDNWITALSTRGFVGSGEQVLIAGLIVSGAAPKQIALRGAGPSLAAAGVQQVLANPQIEVFSGSTRIAVNDDWQSHPRAADLQAAGLSPAHPLDAGMIVTLDPGAYTAILSGVNNAVGVGLVEAYEMSAAGSRFRYWYSNAVTSSQNDLAISPLEFGYDFTSASFRNRPVLFQLNGSRAARFAVVSRVATSGAGYTADPYLEIIRVPVGVSAYTFSQATIVAANDNWGSSGDAATLRRSGFLGLSDSKTAAVVVDVAPGFDYYVAVTPGDPNPFLSGGLTSGTLRLSVYNVTATESAGQDDRMTAVATRGVVGSGEKVMIAGVIIKGSSPRTVFARVTGPSLAALGVQNTVANPRLSVFGSNSQLIATNDNWQTDTNSTMLQRWGAAPTNANEPALIMTLSPGVYTVIADTNGGPEGIANIELYELR
jgi:hypothetical protein